MNFKEQNKTRPRPWIKYYSSPSVADLEYPDGTMYDVFRETVLRNPDAPAIDYMTSRAALCCGAEGVRRRTWRQDHGLPA